MSRVLILVTLLLPSLFGCAVAAVDDEQDPEEQYEAPVLATSAEELSSIDCGEHTDTGYSSGNPFTIKVVTVDGKPVEKSTANAYYVMAQAAAAAGVNLKIVSGFRTMSEQQYLYSCYVNCNCNNCNLAAKPGYSNHQSGHALDLNTSSAGVYNWLLANAGTFGFKKTVPSENWHWEWWGGGPGGGPCGSCKPHCEGSKIVGQDCGVGDCGVFGATCVDDAKGVRCASVFCPAVGQKKVCVNDKLIGDCSDGAISTGDCSAYGAACVDDAKGARCVVVFCADNPTTAHDVCLPNGQLGHCTDLGGISVEDCPSDKPCSEASGGAQCGVPAPPPGPDPDPDPNPDPDPGAGGSAAAGGATGTGSGWGVGGQPIAASSGGGAARTRGSPDAVEGGCACALPGGRTRSVPPAMSWLAALVLLGVASVRRRAPHVRTAG